MLVLGGGLCFALALALAAVAPSFWTLLVAFSLLYPASGAFVSLSQAALMDLEPDRREHNMARWTSPAASASWSGRSPRRIRAGRARLARALRVLRGARARRSSCSSGVRRRPPRPSERPALGEALRAITSARGLPLAVPARALRSARRCPARLPRALLRRRGRQLTATGGLAVASASGAGLAGAAAMIPLLRRVDGLRYLRAALSQRSRSSSRSCSHRAPRPSCCSSARSRSSTPAGTRCCRRGSTARWTERAASC